MNDITEARRAAGEARWAGIGKRSRSRQMKAVRAAGGGRPRSRGPRCQCGKYTLHSAKQRGFDCCKRAGYDVTNRDRIVQRALDVSQFPTATFAVIRLRCSSLARTSCIVSGESVGAFFLPCRICVRTIPGTDHGGSTGLPRETVRM